MGRASTQASPQWMPTWRAAQRLPVLQCHGQAQTLSCTSQTSLDKISEHPDSAPREVVGPRLGPRVRNGLSGRERANHNMRVEASPNPPRSGH